METKQEYISMAKTQSRAVSFNEETITEWKRVIGVSWCSRCGVSFNEETITEWKPPVSGFTSGESLFLLTKRQ